MDKEKLKILSLKYKALFEEAERMLKEIEDQDQEEGQDENLLSPRS